MTTGNQSLNSFGIYFSAKCVSVLLAVFVVVAGMMVGSVATAAPVGQIPGTGKNIGEMGKLVDSIAETVRRVDESYKRIKTFNDDVAIEDAPKLKAGKSTKNQYGIVTQQTLTGEAVKGKVMKLHYLFKPVSLGELDQQRNNKYKELGGKPTGQQHFVKRDANITMQLTARNGDKVIKTVKKAYKNQTDCILEYQVPENVTAVDVKIDVTDVVEEKDPVKGNHGWWGRSENKKVVAIALKPVKKYTAPVASINKTDSGDDAGGIGIFEIGGGLALVSIGGYLGLQFFGGSTAAGEAGAEAVSGEAGDAAYDLTSAEPDVPAQPSIPPEPKEYVYTDPAGFQTLYVQDPETGQWTNYETGNPVDMDSLQEYDKQRMKEMEWSRNETQKLSDRTTAFDNDMKQDYRNMLDEEARIQQQTKNDMMAIKTGTYGMTDAERKAFLESRQAKLVKDQEAAATKAKVLDVATKTLEVVEKTADISISVLSTVTPGGNVIANIYTGVKNVAVGGMQAAVDGKSVSAGIFKGAVKGGADILQSLTGKIPAGKWGYKLATYATTEAMKEGIVAYVDGENVVKATFKGMVQGGSKFLVDKIGGDISDKLHTKYDLPLKDEAMKQKYFKIKDVWSKDLQPKSIKALRELNFQRYFAKDQSRLIKDAIGQTFANEASARAYEMGVEGKSFTESTFGDKW